MKGAFFMKNTTKILLIGIIVLAILGAAVGGYFIANKNKSPIPEQGNLTIDTRSNSEKKEMKNELSGRNVYFAGLEDCTLDSNGEIYLENLPENEDFLIKYTVTIADTNETIFETDLIPSGQHVAWVPSENLTPGIYHLAILQVPYYQMANGSYTPLTSGNNIITVELL